MAVRCRGGDLRTRRGRDRRGAACHDRSGAHPVDPDLVSRAIVARDRHCTHPGCTRGPEWCQIHHLEAWDPHGRTDIDDGTLLCQWHHTHHHTHHGRRRPLAARG